ncbi:hypothetical protein PUN28_011626 [Cardiocondyla obscurior]|uniref:Uncharacterized protein n=1 Tax=Cardiocondyla obscurior TaxID=286306 RepID=A0AAW2FEV1_9HYME
MIQNVAFKSRPARIWGTLYLDRQITRRLFLLYRQNTYGSLASRAELLSLVDSRATFARAIKDMIGGLFV